MDLPAHRLELAILHPQIAANTGTIGRLCVATGTRLNLVRPFGFVLSDANVRRAGLDYWPRLALSIHDDGAEFFEAMRERRIWLFDSTGSIGLFETPFADGDVLCLGSETRGIDPKLLDARAGRVVRIPQVAGERCLNLATGAGIALYAALGRVVAR